MSPVISWRVVPVLLVGMLALNILSIQYKSLTTDEGAHYGYGLRLWQGDTDRVGTFDDSKMPFSVLNVFPHHIANGLEALISPQPWLAAMKTVEAGRVVTILFSLLIALVVFQWTKELYGLPAGLLALTLYAFSPNILAHSRLVTTDLYAAGTCTVAMYAFWRFLKYGGGKNAFLSASALGLSQLAKYTCLFLYPIFFLILAVKYGPEVLKWIQGKDRPAMKRSVGTFVVYLMLFAVVNVLIINLAFLFNQSFTPLGEYTFKSDLFKSLHAVPFLSRLPLPFPVPFIQGMDWGVHHQATGLSFGNIYLFGQLRETAGAFQGFPGYFFVAFLFKVPLAIQLLIIWAGVSYLRAHRQYHFCNDELFLIAPILFYMIYFNFFLKAQIGLRFLLIIFPLLFVFCGSLLKEGGRIKTGAVVVLVGYLIVSNLSYFPHYLSYFNELTGDRKMSYKILVDSNNHWRQNETYLHDYLQEYPEALYDPGNLTPGRIIVSVNSLVGVLNDPEQYRWLRENFEPVDHIAYSYLVYDVSLEEFRIILNRALSGSEKEGAAPAF